MLQHFLRGGWAVGGGFRWLGLQSLSPTRRRLLHGASHVRDGGVTAEPTLPAHARVCIIGGGIIGNSIAYHLAQAGCSDVLLLERDKLTSGTTWHSAGLVVTFGSLSATSTSWRRYTRDLYASLEAETGQATGFKPVGFIELASDADRLEEYRRIAAFNRLHGVDVHEISAREVAALAPLTRVDDVIAGFYTPGDGRVNPVDASMALAKGARMRGARVVEGVAVARVTSAGGRATGVVTEGGQHVACDVVVNAAGMWARQLAAQSGIPLPLQAVEHYYLITDAMPGVDPTWPVVEDPANHAYIRPEAGGMMVGLFETSAAAWRPEGIPRDASFVTIPPDWERITPCLQRAMSRVPATLEVGAKLLFCGPESFTTDGAPLLGESNELRGYYVAAGLNSVGVLTGGGVGRLMARWIMDGSPPADEDVTAVNVDRAAHYQCTRAFRTTRNPETLEKTYGCHFPTLQPKTARGAKRSPLHDTLAREGAVFKDVSGWESPDYYDSSRAHVDAAPCWGRAPWFGLWAEEHAAVRRSAGLIDMSFMSKFLIAGPGASALLNWVCTSNVAAPRAGTITYTQLCNARGTLEGDITVTKLPSGGGCFGSGHAASDDAPPEYLVVATDTAHRHVETWLRRHAAAHAEYVSVTDVTGGIAQLNVQGPRSREVLQRVTDADLSPGAFPFRAARYIDVGLARVLATRITYVGELGYELFIPTEQAAHVCETLRGAAAPEELRLVGLRAVGSLRLEKAYRDYGHDLDNCDTLLSAGLAFTADTTKPGGFLGMHRLLEQQAAGGAPALAARLVQVLCKDPAPMMYRGEVLLRNGSAVGDVRSASYGHTLGGAVGIAHVRHPDSSGRVDRAWLDGALWELDIAGARFPAHVSIAPLYDPKNERIK